VEAYARNLRAETADAELARIRAAGLESIHLAWAGPLELGRPHYFRLHGPAVLIELDNTQNGANHIHSVWHDPRNDFGRDALRAHYRDGHHRATHHAETAAAGGALDGERRPARPPAASVTAMRCGRAR
jgi:hypothetical protein